MFQNSSDRFIGTSYTAQRFTLLNTPSMDQTSVFFKCLNVHAFCEKQRYNNNHHHRKLLIKKKPYKNNEQTDLLQSFFTMYSISFRVYSAFVKNSCVQQFEKVTHLQSIVLKQFLPGSGVCQNMLVLLTFSVQKCWLRSDFEPKEGILW